MSQKVKRQCLWPAAADRILWQSMVNYDELLNVLVKLRLESGDSQLVIAEHLDIHQTTVSSIERGRTKMTIPIALAWAERYGHEITLLPTDENRADQTRNLLSAANELTNDQLAAFARLAAGFAQVSGPMQDVIMELVSRAAEERVVKGA